MELFFREYGSGTPLIILHGLFGSSDNWLTQAKMLADEYRVITVDQRNHGQSPHDDEHNYKAMTEDLRAFIEKHAIENPIILGHSMGGKTAMNFAIAYPEMLSTLIVVDIAPKPYRIHHDNLIEAMTALPVESLQSRNEADEKLSAHVPELGVRQFLLKNLNRRAEGGFSWKLNLKVLERTQEEISRGLEYEGTFEKNTLFIYGRQSNYVKEKNFEDIKRIFTKAEIVPMETGHWVQAEKPQEFVTIVKDYLKGLH